MFLTAEARHRRRWRSWSSGSARRAAAAAVAAGLVALAGLAVLHADAPRLFDEPARPRAAAVVLVSAACGLAALALLRRAAPRLVQALAVLAVAAVVAGWGVAQYPYLLGTHLTHRRGRAPAPRCVSLAVVAAAALAARRPVAGLLFVLQQRGSLQEH